MSLSLNHFSVRTLDLPATRYFYETGLGLSVGPRPEFPFPGLWMYAGSHDAYANAVVHIIGVDRDDPSGLKGYLGDRSEHSLTGSGAVDHVAFFVDGLARMRAHLCEIKMDFRERSVPGLGLHQIFVDDPNGVVIELNFPASEAAEGLGA